MAFKVLVISGGLTLASGVFGAYLSTTNQQKPRAFIAIGSAIAQGLVAIIAVPKFGLWGAVASASIGGLVINFLLYYRCTRTNLLKLPDRELITAITLFLGVMVALLISSHSIPSNYTNLTAGLAFGVLFSALSLIFGIWSKSDIITAKSLFSNRTFGHRLLSYIERFAK